jgi:hypothetical protein
MFFGFIFVEKSEYIMLDKKGLKKTVKEFIIFDGSNPSEYQNKFYLMKKIKENFPRLPENEIFGIIEFVNTSLARPFYDDKYVSLLTLKLYEKL